MCKNYFRKIICLIIFVILTLFKNINLVCATEITILPTRDTYIKPGGGESHGFEQTLLFENVETENYTWRSYVYIMFDLSSLPKEAVVEKGILRLYLVEDASDNCSVQAQRQSDMWNEYENYFSLGYNNTGTIYDIEYIVNTGEYDWDITSLVSEWHSGKFPNYGVVMFATDSCRKIFASRQYEKQQLQPKLVISYHLPPTPTLTPTSTPLPTPTYTPSPTSLPSPNLRPRITTILSPTLIPTPTMAPTILPKPKAENERKRPLKIVIVKLVAMAFMGFILYLFLRKKFPPNTTRGKMGK